MQSETYKYYKSYAFARGWKARRSGIGYEGK